MSRLKSKLVKKIVTAAAVTAVACSDATLPNAPEVQTSIAAVGSEVRAARRAVALEQSVTTSKVIGPAGGEISVGGVTLTVPARALSRPVEITATAPRGEIMHVRFEPHGLQFERPFTLTFAGVSGRPIAGAYFERLEGDGSIVVLESFPVVVGGGMATFVSDHFSAYSVIDG